METACKYLNRDSNMELMRILAMLGILVVHSDFFALGAPSMTDCVNAPLLSFWRIMLESLTIVSVNLFVLLSGWYGIRPNKRRVLEFLFQILFFNFLLFITFSFFIPETTFTRKGIGSIFMLDERFWFVKAYLLLYLMSPVLNCYIEKASKEHFKYLLFFFFLFQTVYGWMFPSVSWFKFGYSTISFIGLYLLASYLRKYDGRKIGNFRMISIFLSFVIINTALSYGGTYLGYSVNQRLFAYNSPLVIIASVAVFLFFTTIRLRSRLVNYVAISSFAAYLLHANYFFVEEVYVPLLKDWFAAGTFLVFSLKAAVFICALFVIAVLIDKIRIWAWDNSFGRISDLRQSI